MEKITDTTNNTKPGVTEQVGDQAATMDVIPPKPKLNALVHGVYAKDLVLPWESEDDLIQLHEELRKDLNPEGRLQEEIVFNITTLHWRKRRAALASQLEFCSDPSLAGVRKLKSWQDVLKQVELEADDWAEDHRKVRQFVKGFCKTLTANLESLLTPDAHASHSAEKPEQDKAKNDVVANLETIIKQAAQKFSFESAKPTGEKAALSAAALELLPELEETQVRLVKLSELVKASGLPPAMDVLKRANAHSLEKTIKNEASLDRLIDRLLCRLDWVKANRNCDLALTISGAISADAKLPKEPPSQKTIGQGKTEQTTT